MRKEYERPCISEELILLEDVIALSNNGVLGEIYEDDGERLGA